MPNSRKFDSLCARHFSISCGSSASLDGDIEFVTDSINETLRSRSHHRLVLLESEKNWIVVVGGRCAPGVAAASCLIELPGCSSDKPIQIRCHQIETSGDELAIWRAAVCSVGRDSLVVTGGLKGTDCDACSDCCLITLNCSSVPPTCQITPLPSLPQPLHSHSIVFCNKQNHVIISGGLKDRRGVALNDELWRLDLSNPDLSGWTKTCGVSAARFGHTSHLMQSESPYLLLIGGVNADHVGGLLTIVKLDDLSENVLCFRDFALPNVDDCGRPLIYIGHDSILFENHLFLIGGGGNAFSFGTTFNEAVIDINVHDLLMQMK